MDLVVMAWIRVRILTLPYSFVAATGITSDVDPNIPQAVVQVSASYDSISNSRALWLVCFGANATKSNSLLTMAQAGALQDCAGKLKTGLSLKCWVVLCAPVRTNGRTHKVVDREYGYEFDHVKRKPTCGVEDCNDHQLLLQQSEMQSNKDANGPTSRARL